MPLASMALTFIANHLLVASTHLNVISSSHAVDINAHSEAQDANQEETKCSEWPSGAEMAMNIYIYNTNTNTYTNTNIIP